MITDNEQYVEKCFGGLPITYEKKKAPKANIDETKLWEIDALGFDSKVGYITNCSTTMYGMLAKYEENSAEYQEIYNRIKLSRRLQGSEIDRAKLGATDSFPKHWVNHIHPDDTFTEEDIKNAGFNNSILIDKRPYFFRYIYDDYNRNYKNHDRIYDNYANKKFGLSLEEVKNLPASPMSVDMMEFLSKYYNYTPLLDTDCVMNNICHHMEKRVKEIKMDGETKPDEHLISLLKNNSIPLDKEKLKSLYDLYKTYKGERTNLERKRDDDQFANVIQYNNYVRNQALTISSNVSELANLAVTICYEIHPSDNKRFAWNIFGDALIDNLKSNSDKTSPVPFADPNGDIEYLGKRYALKQISIETEEDFFDIEQYYF